MIEAMRWISWTLFAVIVVGLIWEATVLAVGFHGPPRHRPQMAYLSVAAIVLGPVMLVLHAV